MKHFLAGNNPIDLLKLYHFQIAYSNIFINYLLAEGALNSPAGLFGKRTKDQHYGSGGHHAAHGPY
jgi:hypothetical protein